METNSRLIWLFDYLNPYFQCGYAIGSVLCAALCVRSIIRRFSSGLLLLGIGCGISFVQNTCFAISAFQDGQPFLSSVPFELRKEAYLYGRLLGPPQLILFPLTVVLLALENMRRKEA